GVTRHDDHLTLDGEGVRVDARVRAADSPRGCMAELDVAFAPWPGFWVAENVVGLGPTRDRAEADALGADARLVLHVLLRVFRRRRAFRRRGDRAARPPALRGGAWATRRSSGSPIRASTRGRCRSSSATRSDRSTDRAGSELELARDVGVLRGRSG